MQIRIVRLITRMNVGGPALHVALLSARLDPGRFATLLVTGRESVSEGSMVELRRLEVARVRVVPSLGRSIRLLGDLRSFIAVLRIIREYRPHIVHTHLAKAGLIGRLAARVAGVPVVVHTFHGTVFTGYFGRLGNLAYVLIERVLARLSSTLIAITPRQRDELVALGIAPPSKIAEIPLGLDLQRFERLPDREASRAVLAIPSGALVAVIVARLVPIKDIGTFIRAIALLRQRLPKVRALVVGDGAERARLEALARSLNIEDVCRFTGMRADVEAIYAAADVVVLASLNEGSPVSLIEAMSGGKAVVATSVGGVPDVVSDGRTGLLVPPRDPRALAQAIEKLLLDEGLRSRLGGAAREASGRFSGDRLVADVEELYEGLLRKARP